MELSPGPGPWGIGRAVEVVCKSIFAMINMGGVQGDTGIEKYGDGETVEEKMPRWQV